MSKKISWNPELITSICAIFISLLTLIVFIYQTNIIRKEQSLSVLPYLTLGNQGYGSPNYQLQLKNDGIGPAFIREVSILYEDETYEMDLPTFLYEHMPAMDTISNILHSNIYSGQLIPAGRIIPILQVNNSQESAYALSTLLKPLDLELRIIYESVYEDSWILSSYNGFPEKVD